MARRFGLTIGALLLGSCTARPTPPPRPPTSVAPETPEVELDAGTDPPPSLERFVRHPVVHEAGRFAVLRPGARLLRGPRADTEDHVYHDDGFHFVEVLGHHDGYVAIQTATSSSGRHCYPPLARALALRLFVAEGELMPVTVHGIEMELGPDAAVSVAPGVVVRRDAQGFVIAPWSARPASSGHPRRPPNGSEFRLPTLDADDLASTYSPATRDSLPGVVSAPADAAVAFEDEYVMLDDLMVFRLQLEPAPGMVVAGDPCVQLAAPVERGLPVGPGEGISGTTECRAGFISLMGWDREWVVAEGTHLRWRDGSEAGLTQSAWRTTRPPREKGRSLCFAPNVGCEYADSLQFCVPRESVEVVEPSFGGMVGKPGDTRVRERRSRSEGR